MRMKLIFFLLLVCLLSLPVHAQAQRQIIYTIASPEQAGAAIYLQNVNNTNAGTLVGLLNFVPQRSKISPDRTKIIFEGTSVSPINCPQYASRLYIGNPARVLPGQPNRIRSAPTRSGTIVTTLAGGKLFTVLDGPVCADNFAWWQIRAEDGTVGWTAEGEAGDYWLEPLDVPAAGFATLIVLDLTRKSLQQIAMGVDAEWSPDSQSIVYVGAQFTGYPGSIFTIRADGTNKIRIAEGAMPAWSSNGQDIAFAGGLDILSSEIFIAPAAGGVARQLTNLPTEQATMPRWSSDSNRLAFVGVTAATQNPVYSLYIVDKNGVSSQMVTTGADRILNVRWSPNSAWLAFVKAAANSLQTLYTTDGNGANLRSLSAVGSSQLDWSTDGTVLLYNTIAGTAFGLYASTPDGTGGAGLATAPFPETARAVWVDPALSVTVLQNLPAASAIQAPVQAAGVLPAVAGATPVGPLPTLAPTTAAVPASSLIPPAAGSWRAVWNVVSKQECSTNPSYWIDMPDSEIVNVTQIAGITNQFSANFTSRGYNLNFTAQTDGSGSFLASGTGFYGYPFKVEYRLILTSPTQATVTLQLRPESANAQCIISNVGSWTKQ